MMLFRYLIILPLALYLVQILVPGNVIYFKIGETEMDTTVTKKEDYNITRQKLNDEAKYPWFNKSYSEYTPSAETISVLKKHRKNISFVVFAGSWCDDTHMWLPKFYKSVELAGIKAANIKLIGVDEDKKTVTDFKSSAVNSDGKIDRIPAFYIYYKGKEIGKIIESPRNNIEDDILEILKPAFVKKRSSK